MFRCGPQAAPDAVPRTCADVGAVSRLLDADGRAPRQRAGGAHLGCGTPLVFFRHGGGHAWLPTAVCGGALQEQGPVLPVQYVVVSFLSFSVVGPSGGWLARVLTGGRPSFDCHLRKCGDLRFTLMQGQRGAGLVRWAGVPDILTH